MRKTKWEKGCVLFIKVETRVPSPVTSGLRPFTKQPRPKLKLKVCVRVLRDKLRYVAASGRANLVLFMPSGKKRDTLVFNSGGTWKGGLKGGKPPAWEEPYRRNRWEVQAQEVHHHTSKRPMPIIFLPVYCFLQNGNVVCQTTNKLLWQRVCFVVLTLVGVKPIKLWCYQLISQFQKSKHDNLWDFFFFFFFF